MNGGKDCALSLFMARQSGFEISGIATFIPADSVFKAHPLGEFHSLVMNFPRLSKEINLKSYRTILDDEFHYLDIEEIALYSK